MKRENKIKFSVCSAFLLFSVGLALPLLTQAALVPCGPGTGGDSVCTFCHLFQLGKNIIDYMTMIVFPIAAVVIIYGGFKIMTAREDPGKAKEGRSVITAAVAGIAIALIAWTVLDTLFKFIAASDFEQNFGPWKELNCERLNLSK